jgi:hypothetical protein
MGGDLIMRYKKVEKGTSVLLVVDTYNNLNKIDDMMREIEDLGINEDIGVILLPSNVISIDISTPKLMNTLAELYEDAARFLRSYPKETEEE